MALDSRHPSWKLASSRLSHCLLLFFLWLFQRSIRLSHSLFSERARDRLQPASQSVTAQILREGGGGSGPVGGGGAAVGRPTGRLPIPPPPPLPPARHRRRRSIGPRRIFEGENGRKCNSEQIRSCHVACIRGMLNLPSR